jgi:hypothetical protein
LNLGFIFFFIFKFLNHGFLDITAGKRDLKIGM